jgi:two-component system nitrogen regulation response regulator GlnG
MASGQEIHPADLPPELVNTPDDLKVEQHSNDWATLLSLWADSQLGAGYDNILGDAMPTFEKILLQRALKYTHGHKQDAAKKLGWGRNTLTRKLKELDVDL